MAKIKSVNLSLDESERKHLIYKIVKINQA